MRGELESLASGTAKADGPASSDFAPYRLVREIGRGAHGSVFLAYGPEGRVALKVCQRPEDPGRLANWERERRGWMRYAAIPPHRTLVRVFKAWLTPDGGAFLVAMELADAEPGGATDDPQSYRPLTLSSVASAEVALPLRQCIDIGERLASALEHLQRHHLLHRDVKPGNVLFIRGRPVIADAGLVVDDREATSLVGTPGYEPPEHHGTPQGDVFSLGRTLWCIATGRAPEEVGTAPCAEADTSDPDLPAFLDIVKRAMSETPERRYRSAKAMRKALTRLHRQRLFRRLRRMLLPVLATTCATLLLALVWALGRNSAAGKAVHDSAANDARPAAQKVDLLGKFAGGAVLLYDFDDEADAPIDKSGGIGDGTVVGATWKRDARGNGCFRFDGMPGYFDHPDLSPDADHDFIRVDDPSRVFPLSDFSISVVCKPENKGVIIGSGQNELWPKEWYLTPGKFSWSWHPGYASGSLGRKTVEVKFPEQHGQLQHLVVRRAGKHLEVFRNGEQVAETNSLPERQLPVYSYGLFIGNMETDEFQRYRRWFCFKGSISHVMIWSRLLSDSEIGELWRTLDEKYGIAREGGGR